MPVARNPFLDQRQVRTALYATADRLRERTDAALREAKGIRPRNRAGERELAHQALAGPVGVVADLGCGRATTTWLVADLLRLNLLVAVDASEVPLATARTWLPPRTAHSHPSDRSYGTPTHNTASNGDLDAPVSRQRQIDWDAGEPSSGPDCADRCRPALPGATCGVSIHGQMTVKRSSAPPTGGVDGAVTCTFVVGDTGIEPVASSVSRKRSPTELIARGGGGNRTRVQGFAGPCLSHSATPPVCPWRGPTGARGAYAERTTGLEPATLTLAR